MDFLSLQVTVEFSYTIQFFFHVCLFKQILNLASDAFLPEYNISTQPDTCCIICYGLSTVLQFVEAFVHFWYFL